MHQALLTEERGALRTKYVHSEILWVLNPSNNVCSYASAFDEGITNKSQISDAIRRFGVSDKTTVLLVVKIHSGLLDKGSRKSILAAMQAVVEGELVSLSSLPDFTNWTAVKKVQRVGFICGYF